MSTGRPSVATRPARIDTQQDSPDPPISKRWLHFNQAESAGLPAQTYDMAGSRVRFGGRRRFGYKADAGNQPEHQKQAGRRVVAVSRPLGVQSRPAWHSCCSRRTNRNDQRVLQVRCGNVETTLDSRTFLSNVQSHRGQGSERGEEHPFSRSLTDGGGTLRINVPRNQRFLVCERIAQRFVNACGDCAPYGNPLGSCKARRRSRKPRGRSEDGVFRDDERRSLSNHLTSGWVHTAGSRCL